MDMIPFTLVRGGYQIHIKGGIHHRTIKNA